LQAINLPETDSLSNSPFKTYDDIIEYLLQEYFLDDKDYVLIGHSYGAIYAADIAVRLVERLRGLITIAAPLTSSLKEHLDSFQTKLIGLSTPFRTAWRDYTAKPSSAFYQALSAAYAPFLSKDPHTQEVIRKLFLTSPVSPLATRYWQKSTKAFSKLEDDMRFLACPKLSILGIDDQLTPYALASTDMQRLGFEVHRVAGGHLPYIENGDTELCILEWIFYRVLHHQPHTFDALEDLPKHVQLRLIELLTLGPMTLPDE
jgi:pimeloyl-ACP methyl ester carboxylesterase